jgi:LysR family transcriptional regulator for metE and metH
LALSELIMELRQLRAFQSIARSGSVAAAATQLCLTPSALSHALKALETELGFRLFDRAGKGVRLNAAGEQFLARIEPHLSGLSSAAESLRRLARGGYTRLRIGAAASACKHVLPRVVRDLQRAFPRVEMRIESADTPALVETLKTGALDLGLGLAPEIATDLKVHPLFRDELMFTFAPSHRWAGDAAIGEEELKAQPFLLYQRQSVTARLVEAHLRGLGVAAPIVMEIGSIEAIKEFARLELGVAVLPPWVAERELRRGLLLMRPPGRKPLRREWAVFHRANRTLSPVEGRFIRLCRAYTAGMPLDRNDLPARRGARA